MRTTSEVIKILRKYTNELQEQFYIEELKLYGSYAKNNQHSNSDGLAVQDERRTPIAFNEANKAAKFYYTHFGDRKNRSCK